VSPSSNVISLSRNIRLGVSENLNLLFVNCLMLIYVNGACQIIYITWRVLTSWQQAPNIFGSWAVSSSLSCVIFFVLCHLLCLVSSSLSYAIFFALCHLLCLVSSSLSCAIFFVLCHLLCLVSSSLSCVIIFVLCNLYCLVSSSLSCVIFIVLCHLLCLVSSSLSCVICVVLCHLLCLVCLNNYITSLVLSQDSVRLLNVR